MSRFIEGEAREANDSEEDILDDLADTDTGNDITKEKKTKLKLKNSVEDGVLLKDLIKTTRIPITEIDALDVEEDENEEVYEYDYCDAVHIAKIYKLHFKTDWQEGMDVQGDHSTYNKKLRKRCFCDKIPERLQCATNESGNSGEWYHRCAALYNRCNYFQWESEEAAERNAKRLKEKRKGKVPKVKK